LLTSSTCQERTTRSTPPRFSTRCCEGKKLLTLKGHTEFVSSVAFSPDGKRIVRGSGDKTIKLWDVKTSKKADK